MEIDDVKARHFHPPSLFGLGIAALLVANSLAIFVGYIPGVQPLAEGGWPLATGSIAAAALFAFVGYDLARPELDGYCDLCGVPLTLQDGSDEHTDVYRYTVSQAPRRAELGPVSIPTRTRRVDRYYCSLECAESDPLDVSAPAPDRQPVDDVSVEAEVSD